MKKRRIRNAFLAIGLLFACGCMARYFQLQYYDREYQPIHLTRSIVTDYPASHFIQGLTCISHSKSYCSSTVLQMIGLWQGIDKSVDYYNWLTGFTYGAETFLPDYLSRYLPYTDPEPGARVAAPYLGLKRNYYVTKTKDLYIEALKSYLAQDYPLRVALDAGVYRGTGTPLPHALLVVGYSDSTVYYYETGRGLERRIPNHPGETMSWETLIASVESFHAIFGLPWTYNFTVFTKGDTETDTAKIWQRAAANTIGFDYTSIAAGCKATLRVAESLEGRDLTDSDKALLATVLAMSVYTRADNSAFIKATFDDDLLVQAADLLQEAADTYAGLSADNATGLIAGLRKCAGLEQDSAARMTAYCDAMASK